MRHVVTARWVFVAMAAAACSGELSNEGGSAEPAAPSGGAAGKPGGSPTGAAGVGGGPASALGGSGGRGGGAGSSASVGGAGGGATRDGSAGPVADGGGQGGAAAGGAGPAVSELSYLAKVVPVLMINVAGKVIPVNATKLDATMKVIEDHDGSLTGIETKATTFDGRIGIEIRGNSSSGYPQKPYGIEIRDDKGAGLSVSILGLPKESDFILHSCYSDKTCMRNALTFALAREMAVPAGRWASRTRYVEVFIDGRPQGLYLLIEKIKRDKSRVNLPEPAATMAAGDISGAYIFSLEGDRMKGPLRTFMDPLTPTKWWAFRSPHYATISPDQKTYLRNAHSTLMKAIDLNPKWNATKPMVDAPSWLDYIVLQELTNNTDGYAYSWHFTKLPDAGGGKFQLGPAWDFDIGYGNVNYNKRYCSNTPFYFNGPNHLRPFGALFKDPDLHNEVRCRYQELRKPGGSLDLAQLEGKLDAFEKHMTRAKVRDQMRWNNIGKYSWPNNYVGVTWADEIRYLKYWTRRRLAWMDANLPGMCSAQPMPPAVPQMTIAEPIKETAARTGICCSGSAKYINIENNPDPTLAMWACPP